MRLSPCASPIVRVLQCVAARGFVCNVALITCLIFLNDIFGLRPGREASFSSPAIPMCSNRSRHSKTVGRELFSSFAMALLAIPSEAF